MVGNLDMSMAELREDQMECEKAYKWVVVTAVVMETKLESMQVEK